MIGCGLTAVIGNDFVLYCPLGDGIGGSEIHIGTFTVEGCIAAVKEQYPSANGATMEAGCTDTCSCYAEFGMTDWSGSTWQSCMFDSEGELAYNQGGREDFDIGVANQSH